jgi:beta-xylosidase
MMAQARRTLVVTAVVIVVIISGITAAVSTPAHTTVSLERKTVGAVYPGSFPDPSILVAKGRYYAYSTQSGGENIQVISSSDLLHWSARRDALPVLPSWAQTGFTWAPAVAHNPTGGYEMFYSVRDPHLGLLCIGRAVSATPLGPFVDASAQPYLCQTSLGGSIDPYVFSDHGTDYLIWKSDGENGKPQQLWSQHLDANHHALVGVPSLLLSATSSWEDGVIEGPAMLQSDGGLFLYFSGNRWSSSAYSIAVVGCNTPLGPCVESPTGQEVSTLSGLRGPGGPTFFVTPHGQTMMAFAAWSGATGMATGRRSLYIDTVEPTGTLPSLVALLVPAQMMAARRTLEK